MPPSFRHVSNRKLARIDMQYVAESKIYIFADESVFWSFGLQHTSAGPDVEPDGFFFGFSGFFWGFFLGFFFG